MLFDEIKLGYPALWLKTTEFSRAAESLISYDFRDFYTIDFESAFSQYVDGSWKTVLIETLNPETNERVAQSTFDPSVSLDYFINLKSEKPVTFILSIIGKPDMTLPPYMSFIASLNSKYRKNFWTDDANAGAIQIIFLSSTDAPEEYAHMFKNVEFSYPNAEELFTVVNHIDNASAGRFIKQDSVKDIVRSGLGLAEDQFVDLCLRSILHHNEVNPKYIYDQKMAKIKQAGILEIIKPTISFANIGGLDNIKDIIQRTKLLWDNREQAKSFGVVPIRRVLMVGVPGTGKSAICQATAHELGLDLARTGISQVMNSFVGQSEQNMRAVFQQIKMMTPLCVWIDEFGRDLSGGASSASVDAGTTDRVHGEFLTGLQELPEDTFLMCAANQIENLRPEMLRADRFDKIVFVGLPSLEERKDIFKICLKTIDTDHQFDLDALAEKAEYFTGAEITALIKEVKFFVVSSELRSINTNDIISYIPNVRNILWNKNRDMIKGMYQYALEQWDWASTEQQKDAKLILSGRKSNSESELAWKI